MWNSYLFPRLWTAASIFDTTPEMPHDVQLDPRAVLLHHPQCMQDLPDIQGEQYSEILVMNNLTSSSSTFIQPTEFNALDHEKKFKFILAGLFVFIILYVSAMVCIVTQFSEPGIFFGNGSFLAKGVTPLAAMFFRVSLGITALSMLISTACGVYANGGFATQTPSPPNAQAIQINIPYSSLDLSIGLGIVVKIVLNIHFNNVAFYNGLGISAVLLAIFLRNKKARKHVGLRLRQLIDRFTVGGNNSVTPIVSIALTVRAQVEDSPRRWAEPSNRYAVTLPEFLNVMDVTETSM